jgi:hypothetical protein
MITENRYIENLDDLNNKTAAVRLENLKKLMDGIEKGELERPVPGGHVNNHIHTSYSFSPYSPAKAMWMAYNAGLTTAGIMDHDSISGAGEFIEAGKVTGIATTIGIECRVDFSKTPLNGRLINNPDQKSIAYMALHGVPHTMINKVGSFFKPFNIERNKRNRLMTEKINELILLSGLKLDFDIDVVPLSKSAEGGSITERHILFALVGKLVSAYGKGEKLLRLLENDFRLNISQKIEKYLLDSNNSYYEYDLLGVLKSNLVGAFYINAEAECPDVRTVIALAEDSGAIPAYPYLGDISESVTGDKKSQKFEDDYIDQLFEVIRDLGFDAVTYMPSRNSLEQLNRVKRLCEQHGFFQISGEDINSPRQSFVCDAIKKPEFANLVSSTYALIGHEKAATANLDNGMFSKTTVLKYPDLNKRIGIFEEIGKR